MSEKGKRKRVLFGVCLALIIVYIAIAVYLMNRFFPGTSINGQDVSFMTTEEAKQLILSNEETDVLTLRCRDGQTEEVTIKNLGGSLQAGNRVEQEMRTQNGFLWPRMFMKPDLLTVDLEVAFDEQVFADAVAKLACMQNQTAPSDAAVVFTETGYQVVKEEEGNLINVDVLKTSLQKAFIAGEEVLDLEASGCYAKPERRVNDKEILALSDKLGAWLGAKITYEIGEEPQVITPSMLQEWIVLTEDDAYLKEDEIAAYVDQMADMFDSSYSKRAFHATLQGRIVLTDKKHKWIIDREKEKEALLSCIKSGGTIEREPYYLVPSGTHMGSEIGDDYVEVDMTAQHLWVYRNGQVVVETDVVTGHTGGGTGTPEIIGFVYAMQRNRTLRGANYASFVKYWAPFYKGYGLHDANWRGSFGGTIYQRDGSHGCVNIPPSVMPKVYEKLELGMPVIVYY